MLLSKGSGGVNLFVSSWRTTWKSQDEFFRLSSFYLSLLANTAFVGVLRTSGYAMGHVGWLWATSVTADILWARDYFGFISDLATMSSGKQLVKGKSGLRMIAVSEDERCPFLLEEPHWTDDKQV